LGAISKSNSRKLYFLTARLPARAKPSIRKEEAEEDEEEEEEEEEFFKEEKGVLNDLNKTLKKQTF
jgi:hypothetical protein